MRSLRGSLAVGLVALASPVSLWSQSLASCVAQQELRLFLHWFEGCFDNDRQVVFQEDPGEGLRGSARAHPRDLYPRRASGFRREGLRWRRISRRGPRRIYRPRVHFPSLDEARNALSASGSISQTTLPLWRAAIPIQASWPASSPLTHRSMKAAMSSGGGRRTHSPMRWTRPPVGSPQAVQAQPLS